MKPYLFMNDVHLLAPHSLYKRKNPDEEIQAFYNDLSALQAQHGVPDSRVRPNGDVWECNNCKKSLIDFVLDQGKKFLARFPGETTQGNHELGAFEKGDNADFKVIETDSGRYLQHHGHITFWGAAKAYKYTNSNDLGAGLAKRIAVAIGDNVRKLVPVKLKPDYIQRAEMYMKKYNCVGIIQGHKHPNEKIDQVINGYRHIVLPRGIHMVEL